MESQIEPFPRANILEQGQVLDSAFAGLHELVQRAETTDPEIRVAARQELVQALEAIQEIGANIITYGQWLIVATWDIVDRLEMWEDMGYSSLMEYAAVTAFETGAWGFIRGQRRVPADSVIRNHLRVFQFWHLESGISLVEMARLGYFRLLQALPYAKMMQRDGKLDPLLMEVLHDHSISDEEIRTAYLARLAGCQKDELLSLPSSAQAFLGREMRDQMSRVTGLPILRIEVLAEASHLEPLYAIDAATGLFTAWAKNLRTGMVEVFELATFNLKGQPGDLVYRLAERLKEKGLQVEVLQGDRLIDRVYEFLMLAESLVD